MKYFQEKDGGWVYRGGSGALASRVVTFAMIISCISMLAIPFLLWMAGKRTGSDFRTEMLVIPLVGMPATVVSLVFVRKRMASIGTVRVDYMSGMISFGGQAPGGLSAREMPTASVGGLVVVPPGSGGTGYSGIGGGQWKVSLKVGDETFPVISFRDRGSAADFAGELSGLISVQVD